MEISCAFPPHPDVPSHIQLAESLGYTRAWLYDSPALYGDVWVGLALAAERTERIGLGTAVLIPSLRHVLTTASAIATIEEMAPGRLSVAIGTGFTGRRMLGQNPLPWREVRSYIEDLRALLHGETVVVDGQRIQMGHPEGHAPARPIATPIVVAANGPRGLAVARELGDGVMCVGAPQEGFDWCSMLVFGTVLDDGEDLSSPRVFEAIGPGISVIYHGAYEANPESLDGLPGGAAWREEIERVPEDVRHLHVHADHLVTLTELDRRHVSPELAGTTFTGSPEQLRRRIYELEDAGLTELLYAPMGPDVPRELRSLAKALSLP
jgi:5,10-methylenetetrahydromethanopterin reductase